MKIPVHQRVRQPARLERGETVGQALDQRVQVALGGVIQLVPARSTTEWIRGSVAAARLSAHPQRLQLRHPIDPLGLQTDQHPGHRPQLGTPRVVLVLARHVGEQHPIRRRGQHRGHDLLVEQRHDRGLGGAERGSDLQPDLARIGRHSPDAGQVPRADLHGRRRDGDAAGGESAGRSLEVVLMAAGLGVGQAVRMRIQRVSRPAGQVHSCRNRGDLGQVGDLSAAGKVELGWHVQDPKHPNIDVENGASGGDDVIDVTPPFVGDGEGSGSVQQVAADAMHALLDENPELTAVCCLTDVLAIGALHAARRRGLSVPDQLTVTGFDDVPEAATLGLTTVAQPQIEKGRVTADLLLSAGRAGASRRRLLPTHVQIRASSGPPRPGPLRAPAPPRGGIG